MAASVAMILDAAAAKPARADDASPHADDGSSGAAMTSAALAPAAGATAEPPAQPEGEDAKLFASADEGTATPAEPTAALVVDMSVASATAATVDAPPVKKVTPTGSRSKSAKNALGITAPKKRGKKKSPEASHPSVGISVDALDKNKVWGNGRIAAVDVENQRLKIAFPGFSKHWDIWTDMLSIAPHCRFSNYPRKNARSWDGRTNLFTGEKIELDDEEEEDNGDDCVSPERVQAPPQETVVLAPPKPPARKPKKGYVLVPVLEDDGVVAGVKETPKPRKSSAALKREAAQPLDESTSASPKPAKKARAPRAPAVAPPPVREPYNDPEVARQRALNESAMDRSAAFLSQCAALWQQQLAAMSERDRKALFEDDETAAAVAADEKKIHASANAVVLESTVV